MATLPLVESGRVGLTQIRQAVLPEIRVPQVDPIGARQSAQDAGTLSQILDRMSQSAFGQAAKLQEQAGLEFAAQNPITADQIEAAKGGNIGPLQLGSNMNIFDAAVRKARSLELSTHFESEGKGELIKMLAQMEDPLSKVTAQDVSQKIATMTDGLGKSLAAIDPEAAYKFRATMATHGNTVLRAAYETDLKRQKAVRLSKIDATFDAGVRLLQNEASVDPDTFEAKAQLFRESVLTQATLLGDSSIQTQYSNKIEPAIRDAKIGVIVKELSSDQYMTDLNGTLSKIRRGEVGKYSQLMTGFLQGPTSDEKAVQEIEKQFLQQVANRRTVRNEMLAEEKRVKELQANDLMIEYFQPSTGMARKREIGNQVAKLGVLSIEQLEKFLDPKAKEGDPYVYANIETRIAYGEITDPEELKRIVARSGMNGKQYQQLNSELLKGFDKDKADARRLLRRVAGVPDVASSFASKDDQHKIDKDRRLNEIWNDNINKFRDENPGRPIPYQRLANEAESQYNATDKADANKDRARKLLQSYVQDELVKKNKVPAGFVIDENTNVDDLVARGIIPKNDKNDTAGYVQKQINILRQTSR